MLVLFSGGDSLPAVGYEISHERTLPKKYKNLSEFQKAAYEHYISGLVIDALC